MASLDGNVTISLDSSDTDTQVKRLHDKLDSMQLASWLASTVDPYIRRRAGERFAREGDDAVGGGWRPLSVATMRMRAAAGYGASHPINKRTGRLEEYITGAPSRIEATSDGAMFTYPGNAPTGELLEKVKTAQLGKARPKTPARPVLAISATDTRFATVALDLYLRG